MTAAIETRAWSPLKWAVVVCGILALQTGFFFWFAQPPALAPWARPMGLAIRMPGGQSADLPGLVSPLALARPDVHGFSGPAWLEIPPIVYSPEQSNPAPFLLEMRMDNLGNAVTEALSASGAQPFEVAARPGPRFEDLNRFPSLDTGTPQSTLTVAGGLADRPLMAPPVLKLQPADTILSNTVVSVVVDSAGRVFAPPVLAPAGSAGSAAADADALGAAANLLFQPAARQPGQPRTDATGLTPGLLIFHWQTVPKPPPGTNDITATR